jgi:hypothetical protein
MPRRSTVRRSLREASRSSRSTALIVQRTTFATTLVVHRARSAVALEQSCRTPHPRLKSRRMETIELIPLVKAYPALNRTYGEVSCVAGVEMTANGPRWIRLYPVPFRSLEDDKQFRKYQPVRVRAAMHSGDLRPETRRPDLDSIELCGDPISTRNAWALRRRFVEPLMVASMCEIVRRQRRDRTSLGVFRPGRVIDLSSSPNTARVSSATDRVSFLTVAVATTLSWQISRPFRTDRHSVTLLPTWSALRSICGPLQRLLRSICGPEPHEQLRR